jgi:hypothetical protein
LEIFTENFHQETARKHNEALEKYIRQNLSSIGYTFSSTEEFYQFCKKRVSRVCFDDQPNYYELYLDHRGKDDFGRLIGSYSDALAINWEVNEHGTLTVKAIIG